MNSPVLLSSPRAQFDVLVIGSGLAGQGSALSLADAGLKVGLVSKRAVTDSASGWAQGGIAAVLDSTDSVESHIADTLNAGSYLNDPAATRFAVEHAAEAVQWLIDRGVPFTREDGKYHLTREGGHSHRRVIHVDDATGAAVQATLTPQVLSHPNIMVMEDHIVVDLITSKKIGRQRLGQFNRCLGAYVLNSATGTVHTMAAAHTLLATGGAGKVYLYTTNPDTSTGDGIAMAWRAGCRVANMEFIQFHPTCLYHPKEKSFLISEAVRGEGGLLKRPDGTRFMDDYDPRAELAPRDIVARAIDAEMKRHGLECVYLDISHQSPDFVKTHFPTIYERCRQLGIDITREPIPVVPAAHYTCGGVVVNQRARTDIAALYAAGEVTCSGLHGANRLASNSLLECLVYARAASDDIIANPRPIPEDLPLWDESRVTDADEEIVIAHNWDELRRFMWDYVGIVRTTKRLLRAQHRIRLLIREIDEFYANFRISHDLLELRNLVQTADLIVRSALRRKESRGLHYSRDFPETLKQAKNTVLRKRG